MKKIVVYFVIFISLQNYQALAYEKNQGKNEGVSLVKPGIWSSHMIQKIYSSDPFHPKIRQHDQDECISVRQAATLDGLFSFERTKMEESDTKCSYDGFDYSFKQVNWKFTCEYSPSWGDQKHASLGGDAYIAVKDSENYIIKISEWVNSDGKHSNGSSEVILKWKYPASASNHCE